MSFPLSSKQAYFDVLNTAKQFFKGKSINFKFVTFDKRVYV